MTVSYILDFDDLVDGRYRFSLHDSVQPRPGPVPSVAPSANELTVDLVTHPDRLYEAYGHLRRFGGQAPGPDGLTYRHLGRSEVRDIVRGLSRDLDAGTYRPGPSRTVRIRKDSGGIRTLHLRNILDRIVSAAIYRSLWPFLDPTFLPCSYAYRPGRSLFHLLADSKHRMVADNLWWVAHADIRNAFPSIAIPDVIADLRDHVTDPGLLDLVDRVAQGHDAPRSTGLDQGDPLSPLLFNERLHHALDVPLHAASEGNLCYARYADNLLVAAQQRSECEDAMTRIRDFLGDHGMTVRDVTGPTHLRRRGARAEFLGYTLYKQDDQLQITSGPASFNKLERQLKRVWQRPNPSEGARLLTRGWLLAQGPTFEIADTRAQTRARVQALLRNQAIREGIDDDLLEEWIEDAHQHWTRAVQGTSLEHLLLATLPGTAL